MSWLHRISKLTKHPLAPILLIVIVLVFFLWPLFQSGIFHTHDGQLHIARIAAYFEELSRGQFPVRWASDLNYGYGTPLFIFYYPLPYFLGSILHFFGISFTEAFKILLGISFIAAPITFYLWLRKLFPLGIALAGALVYGLAPYHFLDLYVRGAIGELFAFVFIPLVLLSIERKAILTGAVWYSLLILSHNAFALVFTAVLAFYAMLRKSVVSLAKILAIGLGLSAFFWLPAMIEQRYTHSDLFISNKYLENFPSLAQLVWSPWGFGTEVSKSGGLSPQIGLMHILIALGSIVSFQKLKKLRWLFIFGGTLFLIALFFSVNVSSVIWGKISFLQKFEFPWRFTALSSFAAAALSVLIFSLPKTKTLAYVVTSALLFLSIPFLKVATREFYSDEYYLSYQHSTDFGAASTIWSAGDPIKPASEPIQIIAGKGTVEDYSKRSTLHRFTINAESDVTVLDSTTYFPGWKVTVDGQKVPIEFQDANYRGFITFRVSQGIHYIDVVFTESAIRLLANIISLGTLTLSLLTLFLLKKKSFL